MILLLWFMTWGLLGCSASSVDVSSLEEIPTFSSKSKGPFNSDQGGQYFRVTGSCLNTVTGFEIYLDDLTIPTVVPATAPEPDIADGEYLIDDPPYDVDCSDLDFDFYVFYKTALANYAANGITDREDPYKIEIRPVSSFPLPSLFFMRSKPVSLRILPSDPSNTTNLMEVGTFKSFRITLRDKDGQETTAAETDIAISLGTLNKTNSADASGVIYKDDCSSPLDSDSLTFHANGGQHEIELCYDSTALIPDQEIAIIVSHPSLGSSQWLLKTKDTSSAIFSSQILNDTTGVGLPPYLVRGATYQLELSLKPISYSGYSIANYSGHVGIKAQQPNLEFASPDEDPNCVAKTPISQFKCDMVAGYSPKAFTLKIPNQFPYSKVNLTGFVEPMCGLCQIGISPSFVSITTFENQAYEIPIAGGGTTYTKPFFQPKDFSDSSSNLVRVDSCEPGIIGAANSNNRIIPISVDVDYTLATSSGKVMFYDSYWDCYSSTSGSATKTITVLADQVGKRFYYKHESEMPEDGIVEFNVESSFAEGTHTFPYYLKND